MSDQDKPIFHHLNHSQSQRILWLLEELEIPYTLVLHSRIAGRAPPELTKTHPLGKAPQLLIPSTGRVLTESTVIASYLLDTYDTSHKFSLDRSTPSTTLDIFNDPIQESTLLSLASTSLSSLIILNLIFEKLSLATPFPLRQLLSLLHRSLQKQFLSAELTALFTHLEHTLSTSSTASSTSPTGDEVQQWFLPASQNPGIVDFIMSWPIDQCVQRKYLDLREYPRLGAWYERCKARPAWKRSLEKGNGYDLTG